LFDLTKKLIAHVLKFTEIALADRFAEGPVVNLLDIKTKKNDLVGKQTTINRMFLKNAPSPQGKKESQPAQVEKEEKKAKRSVVVPAERSVQLSSLDLPVATFPDRQIPTSSATAHLPAKLTFVEAGEEKKLGVASVDVHTQVRYDY